MTRKLSPFHLVDELNRIDITKRLPPLFMSIMPMHTPPLPLAEIKKRLTYLMDGDVATAELILAANLTKRHVKMKCARRGAAAARAALLSNILSVREADRVWSDEGFLIDYDERMLPSSLLSTIRARTLFEISIPACHPLGEAPSSSKPLAVYEVLHLSVSDYRCLQHQITATMQTLSSAAQAALVNSCSGRPRMIVSLAKAAAALAVLDEAPVVSLAHIRRVLDASK